MERGGRKETMLGEKSVKKNSPLHFPWVFFVTAFRLDLALCRAERKTQQQLATAGKGQNEVKNNSLALLDGFNAISVSFYLLMPMMMEMVLGRPLERR